MIGGLITGIPDKIYGMLKRIIFALEGLSLNRKLILAYILVLAVPVIAFGIYSFNNFKKNAELELLKESALKLQQTQVNIDKNLEIFRKAYYSVVSNRSFIDFLADYDNSRVEELFDFKFGHLRNILAIKDVNPSINNMRFYVDAPDLPEIWPTLLSESRFEDPELKQRIMNSGFSETWVLSHADIVLSSNERAESVVSMYHEINDQYGKHLGILEVNMLTGVFLSDIYNTGGEPGSIMFLINRKGETVYDEKSDYFKSAGVEISSLLPGIKSRGDTGHFNISTGEGKILITYRYLPEPLDSYLCYFISTKGMETSINKTRNLIFISMLGGIFLLSIVTYVITFILLKKVKTIITSMRRVQSGDLNADIPVFGNDEISELAHHFRKMMGKINELIAVVVREETVTKNAQIQALQSQINAHFIYNVLEGLKAMTEMGKSREVSEGISALGRIMRYSMDWGARYVTLGDEIDNVRDYISLMNIRYGNKINLRVKAGMQLLEHEMLKMTLQPIVENAIVHGLEPKKGEGDVSISCFIEEDVLHVEVADSGIGVKKSKLEELNRSLEMDSVKAANAGERQKIGLKNIMDRIKLFYGDKFGIELESEENSYLRVILKLPFKRSLSR